MSTNPEDALASMVASLARKTGRSLEAWLKLARASGKAKHGELVGWLRQACDGA